MLHRFLLVTKVSSIVIGFWTSLLILFVISTKETPVIWFNKDKIFAAKSIGININTKEVKLSASSINLFDSTKSIQSLTETTRKSTSCFVRALSLPSGGSSSHRVGINRTHHRRMPIIRGTRSLSLRNAFSSVHSISFSNKHLTMMDRNESYGGNGNDDPKKEEHNQSQEQQPQEQQPQEQQQQPSPGSAMGRILLTTKRYLGAPLSASTRSLSSINKDKSVTRMSSASSSLLSLETEQQQQQQQQSFIPIPVHPEDVEAHYIFLVHGWMGDDSEMSYLDSALQNVIEADDDDNYNNNADDDDGDESNNGTFNKKDLRNQKKKNIVVHRARCNNKRTSDGIAPGGERLANEIVKFIRDDFKQNRQCFYRDDDRNTRVEEGQPPAEKKMKEEGKERQQTLRDEKQKRQNPEIRHVTISFVGNSLGGLYSRYAILLLPPTITLSDKNDNDDDENDNNTIIALHYNVFCTTATPHLGVASHTYLPIPRLAERAIGTGIGKTGKDLFRLDAPSSTNYNFTSSFRRLTSKNSEGSNDGNKKSSDNENEEEEKPAKTEENDREPQVGEKAETMTDTATTNNTINSSTSTSTRNDDNNDNNAATKKKDLIYEMATNPKYLTPLSKFRKRIAYANAFRTDFQVPTETAAFLSRNSTYPHVHVKDETKQSSSSSTPEDGASPAVVGLAPTPKSSGRTKRRSKRDKKPLKKTQQLNKKSSTPITVLMKRRNSKEDREEEKGKETEAEKKNSNEKESEKNQSFIVMVLQTEKKDWFNITNNLTASTVDEDEDVDDKKNGETGIRNTFSTAATNKSNNAKNYGENNNNNGNGEVDNDDILAMSTSLDALGWTKVFIDVRDRIPVPSVPKPFTKNDSRLTLEKFVEKRHGESLCDDAEDEKGIDGSKAEKRESSLTTAEKKDTAPTTTQQTSSNMDKSEWNSSSNTVKATPSSQKSTTKTTAPSSTTTTKTKKSRIEIESRELVKLMCPSEWLHVPLGHTVMVANSKSEFYSRLNAKGRPVMDKLAVDLIQDVLNFDSGCEEEITNKQES